MILQRMRTVNGAGVVKTLRAPGQLDVATYAEVGDRCDLLAAGLASLGVKEGDRVGTFMWNSQEHLEAYMAIPSMGAVLHTLNLRLFPEQLVYIVNHAQDKVILVDDSVIPLLAPHVDSFDTVEKYIVVGDGDASALPQDKVVRYDELLAAQEPGFEYPVLDDHAASGLCYTSGTTGNPKGVLYSHKSTFIHAIAECMIDSLGVSRDDIVLPVVPMFHAQAWGLPYSCTLVGADLIMPTKFLQGEPIAKLIESEKCTVAGAVPTIWMDLLRYADEHKPDLSSLRVVPCGGSAVPRSLMEAFEERHDVPILQAWGMTETSPLGAVAREPRGVEGEERWKYKVMAGQIAAGVEARITDDDGNEVAWDGESTGELEVRGPWIASDYYEDPAPDKFHDGWLKTGDVASINPRGWIKISDRAKDVIKSGGEWISSVDLEIEIMAHPQVREAAVIAMPDERWSERPLACIVLESEGAATAEDIAKFLVDRVAKWWIPDHYAFIDEVPKTSVGKFDKKVLRGQLADGELKNQQSIEAAAKA
jgi:fatty-acyl-CoA synthase